MRIKRYEVVVFEGDVTILCDGELHFATLGDLIGLQSNVPDTEIAYQRLKQKLCLIADAMKNVDAIIEHFETTEEEL